MAEGGGEYKNELTRANRKRWAWDGAGISTSISQEQDSRSQDVSGPNERIGSAGLLVCTSTVLADTDTEDGPRREAGGGGVVSRD